MTLRQLLFQGFESDPLRFRHVAQNIEVAGSANDAIQRKLPAAPSPALSSGKV